jgi:hypothetical protein
LASLAVSRRSRTVRGSPARSEDVSARERRTLAWKCTALLLLNFPAAAGIIWSVIGVATHYTVVVVNASQEPLDDVRIVGGGCDVGFDSIPPGAAARRSFWIQREDTLRFRASRQRGQIEDVVDPYVTRSLGGHATVTVDRNGGVATAQEHRRSDPWFWLHLADCPDPRL